MKLLRICLILFLISNTFAQTNRWKFITESTTNKIYVDTKSIQRTKNKITVWVKAEYPENSLSVNNTDVWFSLAQNTYDCKNKTYFTKQSSFYDSENTIIITSNEKSKNISITPDSVGEAILNFVCKKR